jgi:hypothetical protein
MYRRKESNSKAARTIQKSVVPSYRLPDKEHDAHSEDGPLIWLDRSRSWCPGGSPRCQPGGWSDDVVMIAVGKLRRRSRGRRATATAILEVWL